MTELFAVRVHSPRGQSIDVTLRGDLRTRDAARCIGECFGYRPSVFAFARDGVVLNRWGRVENTFQNGDVLTLVETGEAV